jgi:putative ABC transport system permease protein
LARQEASSPASSWVNRGSSLRWLSCYPWVYAGLVVVRSRDLGFNKGQTLVVNTYRDPHQQTFRQKVLTLPGVRSAVLSGAVPGWGNWVAYTNIENSHGDMQSASLDLNLVDFGFLQQYNLKLLAGRYFSKEIANQFHKRLRLFLPR